MKTAMTISKSPSATELLTAKGGIVLDFGDITGVNRAGEGLCGDWSDVTRTNDDPRLKGAAL
jgi:hypothetical protein